MGDDEKKYGMFINHVNNINNIWGNVFNFGQDSNNKQAGDGGQKSSEPCECDLTEEDFEVEVDEWSDDMLYLPFRERDAIVSMYKRCVQACVMYIRKDVDMNKLLGIFDMIFSEDINLGVYKQCTGKSTNRGICIIIGTWLRCGIVFKEGTTAYDLGKCISTVMEGTDEETIRRNIYKGDSGRSEKLSNWAKAIVKEILMVGRK